MCIVIHVDQMDDNGQKERKKEIMEIKRKLKTQDDVMQKYTASQNDIILKLAGKIDVLTT